MFSHLGHFALVNMLLPAMKLAASEANSDVRIVTVSLPVLSPAFDSTPKISIQVASDAHQFTPATVKFDSFQDLSPTLSSKPSSLNSIGAQSARYALTKLMNIYFARELQRRLDNEGVDIISLSLHPGLVATGKDFMPWY